MPMTSHRAAGEPATTRDSRLIELANTLVSHAHGWQVPGSHPVLVCNQWRPGRPVAPALLIDGQLGGTPFQLALDAAATARWFAKVHWPLMSQAVRAHFISQRGRAFLAWLARDNRLPLEVTGVVTVEEAAAQRRSLADLPALSLALVEASSALEPVGAAQDGRSTAPTAAATYELSLLVDPSRLEALGPLYQAICTDAAARGPVTADGANSRSVPAAAGREGQPALFDFDLLVGRLALMPDELGALRPGDLLVVAREPRPAAAIDAGRDATRSRTLALSLTLGRTPLQWVTLAQGQLHFRPVPHGASSAQHEPLPQTSPALTGAEPAMTADPKNLELDVALRFGKMRMTLAQLAAIKPGQTIPAHVDRDEPEIDIVVDGRVLGSGTLVRVGTSWAVSVQRWGADGN